MERGTTLQWEGEGGRGTAGLDGGNKMAEHHSEKKRHSERNTMLGVLERGTTLRWEGEGGRGTAGLDGGKMAERQSEKKVTQKETKC
jgi:hypothetical protein